jgi:lysophospholipase L1-like esterase
MQAELGRGWYVIEEGLSGRTTVFEDEIEAGRRGLSAITMLLESHSPLDLIILMLGTNDVKTRFGATPRDIGLGWLRIVKTIRERCLWLPSPCPRILLVSPPPVLDSASLVESFAGAPEKSAAFASVGKKIAIDNDLLFFDAGSVVASSTLDGIHLSSESHIILGKELARFIAGHYESPRE